MPTAPLRVLFVCTGNICRSPLAEAIFKALVRERGLEARYLVDSAGTHGWHAGEPADPRTREVGARHGIAVDSTSRPVREADFERFDLLVGMDRGHLRELRASCPAALLHKLLLIRDYDVPGSDKDVPDPYYGGPAGFEDNYSMLERCGRRLLDVLESRGGRPPHEPARAERA